ncbi:uridine kinase, partial [bacterium]
MKRYAIAVAGMSGSGKTTLAEAVAEELGASLLRTDDYYRPLDYLTYEERCEVNFDHPDSVDGELMANHLRLLLRGETAEVPDYDFTRHTWSGRVRRVEASEYVVVEGIFALSYEEVIRLCEVRAFVDAQEETCLQRRIARDVTERGRTPGEVVSRFEGHV